MSEPRAQLPSLEAAAAEPPPFLCVRCNYNLHGLSDEGVCPECALPIGASRGDAPLSHYPPQWLDRVAGAVTLLAVVLWTSDLFRFLVLLNAIATKAPPGEFPTARALSIALDVLFFVGYWLTATPQPQAHEPLISHRRMGRLVAAAMLGIALSIYTGLVKTRIQRAEYYSAFYIVEIAWIGCLTAYLRRLAALLGRPGLGLQAAVACVGWAASLAVTHGAIWVAELLRLTLWRRLRLPPNLPLAEAAWWPFTLYFGVVLIQFRFAFLKAAHR